MPAFSFGIYAFALAKPLAAKKKTAQLIRARRLMGFLLADARAMPEKIRFRLVAKRPEQLSHRHSVRFSRMNLICLLPVTASRIRIVRLSAYFRGSLMLLQSRSRKRRIGGLRIVSTRDG